MLKILAYGCTSAAGPMTSDFWNGLKEGKDHSQFFPTPTPARICRWKNDYSEESALKIITSQLLVAWDQCQRSVSHSLDHLGVILASTKGCTEDFFKTSSSLSQTDPLTPILNEFINRAELGVSHSICVSNACSSTVGALFLAQQWILQKRAKNVIVLSCDQIGQFVTQGFFSLKALTQTKSRPFGADRDGLQLGEAASAILVGESESALVEIGGVGFDTEGFAIARPSHSGASLFKACRAVLGSQTPDLVVAHGTGTIANDEVEDKVFSKLFGEKKIPVTSTKWSIGHTLGASASMDIIAACEILKTQSAFSIANTDTVDRNFKSHYLHSDSPLKKYELNKVLVTSLGFGGVHGAVLLGRTFH